MIVDYRENYLIRKKMYEAYDEKCGYVYNNFKLRIL